MAVAAPVLETPVRRLLVVANETLLGAMVTEAIHFSAAGGPVEVLVVLPAGAGDEAAGERLDAALARFAESGIRALGAVGRRDPVQAMEDALRFFPADEILVSTRPYGESRWLDRDVVGRAWERFRIPLLHVAQAT